ncbi:DNA ligase [Nocardioides mangrovicus]|uniref:DNA ligase (ATP) n=2 Tax=Nocardioides mangrovicus TaxID=2478913 RepID=A0A3L8P3M8_9ACTN|nr:DNA ligase [Nocardioides mangrovicus]
MLATKGERVPRGEAWSHEVKWDGIRALVDVGERVRVWTRTERDVSVAFPELQALSHAGCDLLLDGEIVRLGDGVPSLAGLADRIHLTNAGKARRLADTAPITLLAFDVLRAEGRDLSREPWAVRRERLEALGLDDVSWQVPPTYGDGEALLAGVREQGLEGVVSKKVTSRYEWGARSRSWLKFPLRTTGSYVVGGYRFETDSASRLGAVLLGERTGSGLVFRGRVGSGLAGRSGRAVARLLEPLRRADSPFVEVPRVDALGTVWVEPQVVVDVDYLRITADGRLRQPSFRGVREDVDG